MFKILLLATILAKEGKFCAAIFLFINFLLGFFDQCEYVAHAQYALGHPVGASGGRLVANLLRALESGNGRRGLVTMCESGGMANATLLERL